ncbi:MAG: VLRF1 family aeRF1-type release factor [Thermomicrobiaceae bacterium]
MITRTDLQTIGQMGDKQAYLLSLFLPLFQNSSDTDYNIELKNLLRSANQRYQHEHGQELPGEFDELFEDIRIFIRDNGAQFGRGIALFASPERGIIDTRSVPDTIESSAIVDEKPNLAPLIRLVEDHSPYCTCIISRDHARILVGYLDEIEELTEMEDDEVPGQHDQGGWSQSRFERHIEDHVHRHFKRVAEKLYEMRGEKAYEVLILAGPDEVVSGFEESLHQYVSERVIGHVKLLMEANINDVRQQSMKVLHDHINQNKSDLIEKVENESNANDMGVHGLADTMTALQRGQVLNLVVESQVRSSGVICQECGGMSVSPGEGNTCVYCGSSDIRDMENVVPGLITAAFEQGASISVVDDEAQTERLAGLGGIGALLRFRVEEQTA